MTWTNAFALGTCTVAVVDRTAGDTRELFSGVMGLGDSQGFTDPTTELAYVVAVDGQGSVSLASNGNVSGKTLSLRVVPGFDVSTLNRQIAGVVFGIGVSQAYCIGSDTDGGLLFDTVDPPSPDPFEREIANGGTVLFGCDVSWGIGA